MLWIAGSSYDVVFDAAISMIAALGEVATLADETVGWSYHRDLDLTGFIDGTENPSLSVAPGKVLVPPGSPGAGGSVLLAQKWAHDSVAWSRLPVGDQEAVIGRHKPDSIELSDRPDTSHVARTDQDEFGTTFRRNTPYGSEAAHSGDHGPVVWRLVGDHPHTSKPIARCPLEPAQVHGTSSLDRPEHETTARQHVPSGQRDGIRQRRDPSGS
jgi:Dyp-type peroxidase family